MKLKKIYIFEYQSNENRAFRFFGDTQYTPLLEGKCLGTQILIWYLFVTSDWAMTTH